MIKKAKLNACAHCPSKTNLHLVCSSDGKLYFICSIHKVMLDALLELAKKHGVRL